jgi:hypothetical protein
MEYFTYIVFCSEQEEMDNCFRGHKWGRFHIIPKYWDNGCNYTMKDFMISTFHLISIIRL